MTAETISELKSFLICSGHVPVLQDDKGKVICDMSEFPTSLFESEAIKLSKGLSVKMGQKFRLVALKVVNHTTNDVFKDLMNSLSENTCTIIVGNIAYMIYEYTPECSVIRLDSNYSSRVGLWFYSSNQYVPYYGAQQSGINITSENVQDHKIFGFPSREFVKRLARLCPNSCRQDVDWIPVSGYRYELSNYYCSDDAKIKYATFLAMIRFHLSLLPKELPMNDQAWNLLIHVTLNAGILAVGPLRDYGYSRVRPNMPIEKFDEMVTNEYKNNPSRIESCHHNIIVFTSQIAMIATRYDHTITHQIVRDHCNSQFDLLDPYTSDVFADENREVMKYNSLEQATVEIIKKIHHFARYIPSLKSYAVRKTLRQPIEIIHYKSISGIHMGYEYYSHTKMSNPPVPIYKTIDPYDIYRKYCYGRVSKVMFVPYHWDENPRAALCDYISTDEANSTLNIFPGYLGCLTSLEDLDREDVKMNIEVILNHVREVIADGNEELYKWFIGRIALPIRYPRRRWETVPILIGEQRCGKTSFLQFLIRRVYGDIISTSITGITKLTQKFNCTLNGKCFIAINETPKVDEKSKGNDHFDVLKSIISDETIQIEPKGKECYTVNNFANMIITTNNMFCIPISRGDSRYTFIKCSGKYSNVNDNEKSPDEEKSRTARSLKYFDKLHAAFNMPGMGDYFYTYLLKVVPEEWMNMAKKLHKTATRTIIMTKFEKKPVLYYDDLMDGTRTLPKSIMVKLDDNICVRNSDIYRDFQGWCIEQGIEVRSMSYFGTHFPIQSVSKWVDKKTTRVRFMPPNIIFSTSASKYEGNLGDHIW